MVQPVYDFPEDETAGHDLDPTNGSGDLVVGPVAVHHHQSIIIAANSTDNNNWSASVDWVDEADNDTYQSESKSDIELSSVSEDWARLVRKGPYVKVTFTSEESNGTQNRIDAFVDAHR